jgi:hypothetical protein
MHFLCRRVTREHVFAQWARRLADDLSATDPFWQGRGSGVHPVRHVRSGDLVAGAEVVDSVVKVEEHTRYAPPGPDDVRRR